MILMSERVQVSVKTAESSNRADVHIYSSQIVFLVILRTFVMKHCPPNSIIPMLTTVGFGHSELVRLLLKTANFQTVISPAASKAIFLTFYKLTHYAHWLTRIQTADSYIEPVQSYEHPEVISIKAFFYLFILFAVT